MFQLPQFHGTKLVSLWVFLALILLAATSLSSLLLPSAYNALQSVSASTKIASNGQGSNPKANATQSLLPPSLDQGITPLSAHTGVTPLASSTQTPLSIIDTPSPGITPTVGLTNTPAATVTVVPSPPQVQTIAQDTFQRSNSQSWGTASDGNVWAGDASSPGAFSINSMTGMIAGSITGAGSFEGHLGPTSSNVNILVTGRFNSFKNTTVQLCITGRFSSLANTYLVCLSNISFSLKRIQSGASSVLATSSSNTEAATYYNIRFELQGKTLRARYWRASSAEPGNWTLVSTDSIFTSGYGGVAYDSNQGATVSVSVSSFSETSLN